MNMTSSLKSSLKELTGSSGEAVAEGARRATGETVSPEAARHDPEVVAIARRRKFSGSEKRRLLAEAERCKQAGTLGAFLRREGIYSSMISTWRNKVGRADQVALTPKKRGPKPDGSARQIQKLERDNARLRHKLGRAELIIDAQKNCALLWSCRRRTTAAGTRDARRRRTRLPCRLEECVSSLRAEPRLRVPRSQPAQRDHAAARIAGAASVGTLDCRAGSVAGLSRQRALRRHGAGCGLCHAAR